ncbi:MAG TPA: hypothetical protein VGA49_01440, partial [Patescibacteria group bacterium]
FDRAVDYKIYRKNLLTAWPVWPRWLFLFYYVYDLVRREKIEYLQVGQVLPVGAVALIYKKNFKPALPCLHSRNGFVVSPKDWPEEIFIKENSG